MDNEKTDGKYQDISLVTRNQAPAWLCFYVAKQGLSYKGKRIDD